MHPLVVVEPDKAAAERLGGEVSRELGVGWWYATTVAAARSAIADDADVRVVVVGKGVPVADVFDFASEGLRVVFP